MMQPTDTAYCFPTVHFTMTHRCGQLTWLSARWNGPFTIRLVALRPLTMSAWNNNNKQSQHSWLQISIQGKRWCNNILRQHTGTTLVWNGRAVSTHPQCCDSVEISISPIFFLQVVALWSLVALAYFPQLYSFVFEWEKKAIVTSTLAVA